MCDRMVDRLKVISDLEEQIAWIRVNDFHKYPGWGHAVLAMRDAAELLKTSFTPKEVYDTVVEHGQHDKRFKLGDKIDYSFTEVVYILNVELMCKAGDV